MSRKIKQYRILCGTPAVESNFWVFIPDIETSAIAVEQCTLPLPVYKEIALYDRGREFYYPGTIANPGEWSCTLTETQLGLHLLEVLTHLTASQNLGGSAFKKSNIIIAVTYSNTMIPIPASTYLLSGTWIKSVTPLNLNSSGPTNPLKIRVNFRYDSIKNVVLNTIGLDIFNKK